MKLYYDDNKFYNHLEEWVGAVLVAIMLVCLFIQVIMRSIFHASAAWISEYCLYMFMYMVFLACSAALLRNDHIQVVALVELLPKRGQDIMRLIIMVLDIAFCGYVGYYAVLKAIDQFRLNTVSIIMFPLWIMTASLVVGMAGSVIRCLMNIYFILRYELIQPGTKEGR